jgi:hypothetical protein
MKPDLYTKAVLTVIALLLAVNAFRPVLISRPVHAATGHTYMVAEVEEKSGGRVEDVLNKHSAEGWEPVTAYSLGNNWVSVIFKK